jgi:hypothetical protein
VKNGVHTAQWPLGISGEHWMNQKSYEVKKVTLSLF